MARMKRAGRPKTVNEERSLKVMELSISVASRGQDVDASLMPRLEQFLRKEAIAGKCSIARGGTEFHLHFQMVLRIQAKSMVSVSNLLKQYLGWDSPPPTGGVVTCRALRNKGLHTFHGLLGYCMKDMHEPHFQTIDHNVSAEDLERGVELYAMFGVDEKLRNQVCLNQKNTLEHAAMYCRRNACGSDFVSTLHEMVRSGKYYPSSTWIVPSYGAGVELSRANALLRTMISPSTTSLQDIKDIFFGQELRAEPINDGALEMFNATTSSEVCDVETDE